MHRKTHVNRRNLEYVVFLLPAFLLFASFFLVPFFRSIFASFTNAYGYNTVIRVNFPQNYIEAFTDGDFLNSLAVTAKYTLIVAVGGNAVSLCLALLLESGTAGRNALRTIFFLPNVMSLIITGFVWTFLYGDVYHSLVELLGSPGFLQISWLGDTSLAIFSIGIAAIWQGAGYAMIIYIASLQGIPVELTEAATVDGASPLRIAWSVKLPLLAPTIVVNLILSVTTCFKAFDFPLAMTGGGPAGSTTTLALYVYQLAFKSLRTGYATAISVIMFIVVAAITAALRLYQNRREATL